jgi:polysaccharide chain length determinant protein (PEP-CTERM system associated)
VNEQQSSSSGSAGRLFGEIQLRDYLGVARRRKWWIILTFTVIFVSAVVVAMRMPNIYRSETVILVDPQKVPDSYVPSTVTTSIQDRLSTIQQQVMSPSRLKRIIDSLGLYPSLRGRISDQRLIAMMQKSTVVEVTNPGYLRLSSFKIAFHGKDPVTVSRVANELAALFIEENMKAREQQFYGTADFLNTELQDTKIKLEQKERELQAVKSRFILDLPESKQYHLEALTNLRSQVRASQDRVNQAQQQKVMLQSMAATSAPTVDLDSAMGSGSPYASQVQKLDSRLAELRSRYGANYPDVRKAQRELDQLKNKAAAEEKNGPAPPDPATLIQRGRRNPVLEAQYQKLNQQIEDENKLQAQEQVQLNFHVSKLERVPIFEQQIVGMMRDYDSLRGHYQNLLDKRISAEMASALESRQKAERFVILDAAPVPEKPFAPNRPMIVLAALIGGLLGGIGLGVLVEGSDESVRSENEAASILGKPVLAGIPLIRSADQLRASKLRAFGAVAGTAACSVVLGLLISRLTGWLF